MTARAQTWALRIAGAIGVALAIWLGGSAVLLLQSDAKLVQQITDLTLSFDDFRASVSDLPQRVSRIEQRQDDDERRINRLENPPAHPALKVWQR